MIIVKILNGFFNLRILYNLFILLILHLLVEYVFSIFNKVMLVTIYLYLDICLS